MSRFHLTATATFGLEAVVARELEQLGYGNLRVTDGRVHFRGDEIDIARCNLWLRSADRILICVGEFPAADFDALFDQTKALPWADLLPIDAKFPVAGRSVQSALHSVPAVQGCVKKAVVESLRRRYQRFRFEESGALYRIEVSLLKNLASLTIDTSGDGLHKRGYRQKVGAAPLRETMAAGLIQLSYWNRARQLVDPFCGSGTIPIEAALIGRNIAPGIARSFIAEDWHWFDRRIWKEARTEARDLRKPRLTLPVLGYDHDYGAIKLSERGAREAGVAADIEFRIQELSDFKSRQEYGVIITNPPYGERLGDPVEVEAAYRVLGRVTSSLETWSIYAITSNRFFEKHFGRRAPRRRKLFNGKLECQYYQYPGPPPPRPAETLPADDQDNLHQASDAPAAVVFDPQSIGDPWQSPDWIEHAQMLLDSFEWFVGRPLIPRSGDPEEEAKRLFESPLIVVSHGTQSDPILNYGNRAAMTLWEMDAPTLTSMPSRKTAEPMHRDERAQMMARAARDGFVSDYHGIRISSSGKRFQIHQAIVWNLVNSSMKPSGQAATFTKWSLISENTETRADPSPDGSSRDQ